MSLTVFASLIIVYSVVQTIVFLLLIRFADLYEREPISLLGLMTVWGAVGATTLSAVGNTVVRNWLPVDVAAVFGRAIYAPTVEEVAKGLALVVFLIISVRARGRFGIPRFEGVTDGIVYGAAIGLGFAFTEDILYLLVGASQRGLEEGFVGYLARRDFFGIVMLRHAIYTATFGVGLGLATWTRNTAARFLFPLLGLVAAFGMHAFNNGWARLSLVREFGFDRTYNYLGGAGGNDTSAMDAAVGRAARTVELFEYVLLVLLIGLVLLWLRYQRGVIREELTEEADSGLISRTELQLLPSYWQRSRWYWQLLKTGQWERWRLLQRMHNELVGLALLKRRARRRGADDPDIQRRRRLIESLKTQKVALI
jgi:RsiW-degrading membrane proteinase PrsW (M82 family)